MLIPKKVISLKQGDLETLKSYDLLGRVRKHAVLKNGVLEDSREYFFDGNGNLIKEIINWLTNSYKFDKLDELTQNNGVLWDKLNEKQRVNFSEKIKDMYSNQSLTNENIAIIYNDFINRFTHKNDYAHQNATYAHSVNPEVTLSQLIPSSWSGWYGDITIAPIYFDNSDYKADLDAFNIFMKMKQENIRDFDDAMFKYYEEIKNPEKNRAKQFLLNKINMDEIYKELNPHIIKGNVVALSFCQHISAGKSTYSGPTTWE